MASTPDILPLERPWVSLIGLEHHQNGAKTTEEVVKYHASFHLIDSIFHFIGASLIIVTTFVTAVLWQTSSSLEIQVCHCQHLDFFLARSILMIVLDAACFVGMAVVAAQLVKVGRQVVQFRVPHGDLVVDQHQLRVVAVTRQDVTRDHIIVRKDDPVARDKLPKSLLVASLEEGGFEQVEGIADLLMAIIQS